MVLTLFLKAQPEEGLDTLLSKLAQLVVNDAESYEVSDGERVLPARYTPALLNKLSADFGINLLDAAEQDNLIVTVAAFPDLELNAEQILEMVDTLTSARTPPIPASSASVGMSASRSRGSSASSSSASSRRGSISEHEHEHDDSSSSHTTQDMAGDEDEAAGPLQKSITSTPRNVFEGRERTAPLLDATPIALKKRPRRTRGRSETDFSNYASNEQSTPKPSAASRRNSVQYNQQRRMLSNPTSPILSPTVSSPTSPIYGPSGILDGSDDYFSPPLPRARSMSPDVFSEHSFGNPIPSPNFGASNTTHHSFASFATPSGDLFLDTSLEDIHSSSPPSTPPSESIEPRGSSYIVNDVFSDTEDDILARGGGRRSSNNRMGLSSSRSSSSYSLGLGLDDSPTKSDAAEKAELEKMNEALRKNILETKRDLEQTMSLHESEVADYQNRIEELKMDLVAVKKEEKELRTKSKTATTQLATLEAAMAHVQRQLDTTCAQYQTVQRQYQEQCAMSESYRNTIRKKDDELRHAETLHAEQAADADRWKQEQDSYEKTITSLQSELQIASEAHHQLQEQKANNLQLKETIDRLRLDLDEIRNVNTPPNPGSNAGTMMLKNKKRMSLLTLDQELGGSEDEAQGSVVEGSEVATRADSPLDDAEFSVDDEGFEETIITRRRKAIQRRSLPAKFFNVKQLGEASTQHDPREYTSSTGVQTTGPRHVSVTTQTSPQASPIRSSLLSSSVSSTQSSRDVFDTTLVEDEEDARSASSTLAMLSPSPNHALRKIAKPLLLSGVDLPPSYAHLEAEAFDRPHFQRWDPTMSPTPARSSLPVPAQLVGSTQSSPNLPSVAIPTLNLPQRTQAELDAMSFDEVSREAVERWKILKRELGIEVDVIERALSARHPATPIRSPRKLPASPLKTAAETLSSDEYVNTLTPRMAREWANQVKAVADAEERERERAAASRPSSNSGDDDDDVASEPENASRSPPRKPNPRWQFYNLYNSMFYPTASANTDAATSNNARQATPVPAAAPKRGGWNMTLTGMGVWALVLMTATVLPAAIKSESNGALDVDRRLWDSYNSFSRNSPFDGGLPHAEANDAFWTVAENLIVGAANVVRRLPPT
ncbi:hypothetical protein DL93DRAFT_2162825 [Clavulina sp. PMI_390]|nr:hypothetical protein DL93DRAFT_2162825 [Clavulina sp. PMI_390]